MWLADSHLTIGRLVRRAISSISPPSGRNALAEIARKNGETDMKCSKPAIVAVLFAGGNPIVGGA